MRREAKTASYPEIQEEVAKLCADFPGDYWRKLDGTHTYPTEFLRAPTQGGYLAVLIPKEYGGSGLQLSGAAGAARGDGV